MEVQFGEDGLTISERHHIHHGNLVQYSIPHDHDITWENHYLNWGTPQKPGMVLFQNSKYMEEAS